MISEKITIDKIEKALPEKDKTSEIFGKIIRLSPFEDIDSSIVKSSTKLVRGKIYLAFATGEQRTCANVLITVGVI